MLPAELLKKIAAEAHSKKAGPKVDHSSTARKAAVKKMIAAIKSENDEQLLQAFDELRVIEDTDGDS
jgi:hypothetical protein